MRILFLATDAYGGHGGIAYYNRCLAEAFAAMPLVSETTILVRRCNAEPGQVPPRVRFVSASAGGKFRYMAAAVAQSLKPHDLIICGHVNLLPLACSLGWLRRVPVVLQVHGIEAWKPTISARRWLPHVASVWAVSSVTRDRMNAWAGLSPDKYTIIPNTIRPERYGLAPKRADLLDRYGLANRAVIVSLGRLASSERYKGFDEIMQVMPSLIERVPTLSYLILGDGDDRPRLAEKARALGLTDRVRFAGYVGEDEKADHLRLGDTFAMPGRGEGFGIAYLEAMACGIPVVGSLLDGSRDALRDGMLGELVNPDDSASLRAGLLNALSKPRRIPDGLEYFAWPNFMRRVSTSTMRTLATRTRA